MAEYLIQSETLDEIADAINAKTGGSSAMTPAEMVTAIAAIPSGGGVIKKQSITLASELNSYQILDAMNARCFYKNSLLYLWIFSDNKQAGGGDYTNNDYRMCHKGTRVTFNAFTQVSGKVPANNIAYAFGPTFEGNNVFVNSEGRFNWRSATASILAPIGAICVTIEIPIMSNGEFDLTPFGGV